MTLAALMLRDRLFSRGASRPLKYATLGVAVRERLDRRHAHQLRGAARADGRGEVGFLEYGSTCSQPWAGRPLLAVLINAFALTMLFRRELVRRANVREVGRVVRVPRRIRRREFGLVVGVVVSNHDREVFMGIFLVFLGLAEAYKRYHDRLLLREGLMVAFFLAGLIVIGGQQQWWLEQVLSNLDGSTLFFGAAALTAITDNAALTYLGSLVEGVSEEFKYALVAGAVAGGGLTVIANAPNPAGYSLLKDSFDEQSINPLGCSSRPCRRQWLQSDACGDSAARLQEVFDVQLWQRWFSELDRPFLFLLILPFVVAAVGLWAELIRDKRDAKGPTVE